MKTTRNITLMIIILYLLINSQIMYAEPLEQNRPDYEKTIGQCLIALKTYPDNKTIKNHLAFAYLEMAMELKNAGQSEKAITWLEKASELNTNIETIHSLLAVLYYEKGDLLNADKEARIALLFEPGDPFMLKFKAKISYLLDDYRSAISAYQSLTRECEIPADKMSEIVKIQQEKKITSTYKKISHHPFIIYYPDETYRERAEWIAGALEHVDNTLYNWWNFVPEHDVVVFIYPEEKFLSTLYNGQNITGIYDGKIRLLVNHHDRHTLEQTAIHEYTHFALANVTHGNIPFWCDEGIAQFVAGQWTEKHVQLLNRAICTGSLMRLKHMENHAETQSFTPDELKTAYLQSCATISFLADQYGTGIIGELVNGLKEGKSAEEVLKEITLLSYSELEKDITAYYSAKHIASVKQDTSDAVIN